MTSGRKRAIDTPKPSDEAYHQVLGLLELGERSSNPDIRAAAIEIARNTSTHQRDRALRVSPKAIMLAGTLVLILAVAACWYAQTHYAAALANSITEVVLTVAVLLIALYTLLSGHLSQENFVKLCTAVWDKFKGAFSSTAAGSPKIGGTEADVKQIQAGDDPKPNPD
jgi:hypothetical protein